MERGIRIPIDQKGIDLVRKYQTKGRTEVDELATLAGCIYWAGGRSSYVLARGFLPHNGDIPQSNNLFIGARVRTRDEIMKQTLLVESHRRRLGFIYWAVAVSDIVKKDAAEMATAMIVGYLVDNQGSKVGKPLEVPFMSTTAPPPIRWYGVTDFDKGTVEWPEKVREEHQRHALAREELEKYERREAS